MEIKHNQRRKLQLQPTYQLSPLTLCYNYTIAKLNHLFFFPFLLLYFSGCGSILNLYLLVAIYNATNNCLLHANLKKILIATFKGSLISEHHLSPKKTSTQLT